MKDVDYFNSPVIVKNLGSLGSKGGTRMAGTVSLPMHNPLTEDNQQHVINLIVK